MASAVDRAVETIRALAATTELDYVDISWGALKPLPMYTQAEYTLSKRRLRHIVATIAAEQIAQSVRHLSIRRAALWSRLTSPSFLSPCSTSARSN